MTAFHFNVNEDILAPKGLEYNFIAFEIMKNFQRGRDRLLRIFSVSKLIIFDDTA
ncbi:hypothetical protein D3C71_1767990 [compost metagenome]